MADPLISTTTGEWTILRRHIDKRIEKLRDDLEQFGAGDDIRGEIAGLRWLIGMVEVEPISEEEEASTERPTQAGGY